MNIGVPQLAASQLVGYVLVLCRVGGLFALAPIFSGRMIPVQAKLIVAGAISFALAPLVLPAKGVPTGLDVAPLIMKELLVGLAFALALGALGAGISAAASLLDTTIGFSFAALVDPVSNAQSAVIGQVYSLYSVLVFLLIGGDHLMIEGLAGTYRLVPVGVVPSPARLAVLATHDVAQVFLLGVEIAAPVLLALGLVDIALALVARTVPQLNVFIVGLPGKIFVGLGAIAASLPFLTSHLEDDLQNAVYSALQSLGGR